MRGMNINLCILRMLKDAVSLGETQIYYYKLNVNKSSKYKKVNKMGDHQKREIGKEMLL